MLNPDSSSTKLSVVFDASAKTPTKLSLNDVLMEAPVIQSPLFDIMLRWRLPKNVFTANVKQMYRQVLMHDAHMKYYGVGPAGFLATRPLIQLAQDAQKDYPNACEVVLKPFYVDDTGADSLEEAWKLCEDLQTLLEKGGFKLHKW